MHLSKAMTWPLDVYAVAWSQVGDVEAIRGLVPQLFQNHEYSRRRKIFKPASSAAEYTPESSCRTSVLYGDFSYVGFMDKRLRSCRIHHIYTPRDSHIYFFVHFPSVKLLTSITAMHAYRRADNLAFNKPLPRAHALNWWKLWTYTN